MTRIRRSTLPLFAALLLGQGPLCELFCAPSATLALAAGPVAVADADQPMPPCHGPESSPDPAPRHSEHECTVCDQVASSGSFAPKPAASPADFQPGATVLARLTIHTSRSVGLRPPDDRAPPRRSILLQKSSLLL